MMAQNLVCFDEMKIILKNVRTPEVLDDHPWTRSLIVQKAIAGCPRLKLTDPFPE